MMLRPSFTSLAALALLATASASAQTPTRRERDLLGEKEVPAHAHHAVQTARALENLQTSGMTLDRHPELEIIRERRILSEARIQELLDPKKLTGVDPKHYRRSR